MNFIHKIYKKITIQIDLWFPFFLLNIYGKNRMLTIEVGWPNNIINARPKFRDMIQTYNYKVEPFTERNIG